MILRSDIDLARFEILHRLVAAAMSELQFESLAAKCLAENLMTEANSENGQTTLSQIANSFDGIPKGRRIPRPIGKENTSGFVFQCFGSRSGGRQHGDSETVLTQSAEDVVFHPIIKSDDRNICGRQCGGTAVWRIGLTCALNERETTALSILLIPEE